MTTKFNTWLPIFPGFYGTIFGDEDCTDEQQALESHLEYLGITSGADELVTALCGAGNAYEVDYKALEAAYVKELTEAVSYALLGSLPESGLEGLEFQEVRSPREYNFANDAGNIGVLVSDEALFTQVLISFIADNRVAFDEHIKSHYTSGPGFMSSYSNDPDQWVYELAVGEILKDPDHKLGRLLEFVLEVAEYNDYALYYDVEKPYIGEYMSGPLFDMTKAPDDVQEILKEIDRGDNQFDLYAKAMGPKHDFAAQLAGLKKNQGKIYKIAVEKLMEEAA